MLEKKLNLINYKIEKINKHLQLKPNDKNSARFLMHTLLPSKLSIEESLKTGQKNTVVFNKKKKLSEKTLDTIIEPKKPEAPKYNRNFARISPPVAINLDNVPEKQINPFSLTGDDRMSYSTPPLIGVEMPEDKEIYDAVVKFFKSKGDNLEDVIRKWAIKKYATYENAQNSLVESAKLNIDASFIKTQISSSSLKDKTRFLSMSDEELCKSEMARKIAVQTAQIPWVDALLCEIFDPYKNTGQIDVGHAKKKFKEQLHGFHSCVNSTKTQNTNFPYLSQNVTSASTSEIVDEALLCESMDDLYEAQKKLGKLTRKAVKNDEIVGTISARQQACIIYDRRTNNFCLAIPSKFGVLLDFERYTFFDGSSLLSANDLITNKGNSKSCIVLPLKMKHDFRRWYLKHVDNHDPDAKIERRCTQKTLQFKMKPLGNGYQILLRLGLRFYNPFHTVERLQNANGVWKAPEVQYFIGIDRGVNSPFQAVVYDSKNMAVVERFESAGRKDEWNHIKWEISVQSAAVAKLKKNHADARRIKKAELALSRLYKKSKGISRIQVVEAVAKMADYIEEKYGTGKYCYVLETLSDNMNLQGSNRVKWIAQVKKALTDQMIKKGYRHKRSASVKDTRVDGVINVIAAGTSQVAPSGFISTKTINNSGILGRNIGHSYLRKPENGIHLKKTSGMKGDTFGCQLFYDGNTGKIYDADYIAAINIALRPLLYNGMSKLTVETFRENNANINPLIKIECDEPVYEFVEINGDPEGGIRFLKDCVSSFHKSFV